MQFRSGLLLGVWVMLAPMILLGSQESNSGSTPKNPPPATAQEAGNQESSQSTVLPAGLDYIIGPEDLLKIDVFQVPELSGLEVRVANDGTITLPLLGQVKASGSTAPELAKILEAKWGQQYLQDPQVSVFVKEYQAKPVSIVGAVERPGLYYLTGPRTLIELISMAGGLAKRSSAPAGRSVYVTRAGGFDSLPESDGLLKIAPNKVQIDLHKLFYSKEETLNIPIRPMDVISVTKADVVYVMGRGVQRQDGFVLEDRGSVTVMQAVAMAGGLSPNAKKHFARIVRTQVDGSRMEIPVDLKKIEDGKSTDPVLVANDILFVPDNSQKAALKKSLDTVVSTVSGMLIFRGAL